MLFSNDFLNTFGQYVIVYVTPTTYILAIPKYNMAELGKYKYTYTLMIDLKSPTFIFAKDRRN